MELYQNLCKNCGGDLHLTGDGKFKCEFCGSVFEEKVVVDYADEMHKLFDEFKLEAISNARKNLYEAVNAEYISTTRVHECCVILKQLLPDDFQANFYEIASGNNLSQITKAIRKIDVEENFIYVESVIGFLIRSLQTAYQLELNNLIARAFEYRDPVKFEKYCTWLADEAVKADSGVYETKLPREVFVAYSSKDMETVMELVEVLEAQGLKCFVAARNLRHGKGAVENYNAALEEAMDHCRSFVFVSSTNSRSFNCDALTIELPYVQKKDLENAPAEYRNNYKGIPQQYKKPRVEYRIGESTMMTAADTISGEIFDGYERAYTPDEVAARVMKQLVAAPKIEAVPEQKKTKFCIACLSECDDSVETCPTCGGAKFGSTKMEAELMKELVDSRKRTATTEAPAASGAPASNVNSLLKRAFMFLEDGKWNDANEYCEKVLDIDPENAEAYLGKLMAELHIKSRAALANCEKPFDSNDNYKKILRFGGTELKAELSGYIKHINDRNEQARLEELYLKAVQTMNAAKTEEEYKKASSAFTPISGYKDADTLAKKCLELAEEARIAAPLEAKYSFAVKTMNAAKNEEEYKIASSAFASIKGYKDSDTLAAKCIELAEHARIAFIEKKYSDAVKAMNSAKSEEDYQDASKLFVAINQYKDSDLLSKKCLEMAEKARIESLYCKASQVMNTARTTNEFKVAYELFVEIKEYKDSATLAEKCLELEKQIRKKVEARSIRVLKFKYNFSKKTYSVKKIKSNCPLSEIIIPATYIKKPVTSIGDRAFAYCKNFISITIPDSVTSIGAGAFSNCSSLTSITIPDSVTSIGSSAFWYCSSLNSITIPDGVTSIGDGAFNGCSSLTSITIPDSVTSIGVCAFSRCSSLTSITIPNSVKNIGDYAFDDCSSLVSITVDTNNDKYKSINGNLYSKDGKTLIQYAIGKTDRSFAIPDTVTSIGVSAFGECSSLTSITIPDSVTSIGYSAFKNCSSLASITIPDSVTSIGSWAFKSCRSLTSITIPDSVTSIGDDAFGGCSSLETVYYTGTEAEWKSISIGDYNSYLTSATKIYNYVPEE